MIRCPEMHRKRDPELLRTETDMTSEQKTAHILFENKQFIKVARMIRNMWEYRKDRLRPPSQKKERNTCLTTFWWQLED